MENSKTRTPKTIERTSFAKVAPKPTEEKDTKGFIKWGRKNDFPFFLNDLTEGSPVHGGIIKNKVRYIAGGGVEILSGDLEEFLLNAYSDFDMNEIAEAICEDGERYGGFIVKGTYDMEGTRVVKWEHLPMDSCRFNLEQTIVYLSNDWNAQNQDPEKTGYRFYSVLDENITSGSFFIYYKDPTKKNRKELGVYPKPPYYSGISAIETDWNLNKYNNALIQNSFSSGTMIVFTDGEPETEEEIQKIKNDIKAPSQGAENAGEIIITFAEGKDRAPLVMPLNGNDLDKRYTVTNTATLQNILIAHGVVSPTLFGVMQQGSFNAAESAQLFEVFKKTYVMQRQARINWMLNKMAKLSGYVGEVQLVEVKPIEDAVNNATPESSITINNAPTQTATETAPTTAVAPVMDATVTDVSKTALNGAQIASLVDVVAKAKLGEIDSNSAVEIILASFPSIDQAQAQKMVGVTATGFSTCKGNHSFSKDDLTVFAEFGEGASNFEEFARIPIEWNSESANVYKKHEELFATIGEITIGIQNIDKDILALLNKGEDGNGIAKATNLNIKDVALSIARLTEWGLVSGGELSSLGDRLISSEAANVPEFEVRYSYQVRTDVPDAISGSREFCSNLIDLNRLYTREEINTISSRVDRDVWVYKGGFYTNPESGVTTPWCRHLWFQSIVKKS